MAAFVFVVIGYSFLAVSVFTAPNNDGHESGDLGESLCTECTLPDTLASIFSSVPSKGSGY